MSHFDPEELKNIKPGPILWMAAHPVAANLLMVLIIFGGIFFLLQSKKEVFPEFELDLITVTMIYPGASPEEVEKSIVLPIENALRDVDGLENIKATASEGYANVNAEVIDENEMIRIAQDVKTAVDQITTFPVDAEDLTVTIPSRRENLIDIVLYGTADDNALRSAAEYILENMEQHEHIGSVELSGVRDYEIHIEISQENLRRYNLTFPDIATLVSRTAIEIGGGSLKSNAGEILVRMDERRDTAIDFGNVPVINQPDGNIVTLSDIATIKETFADKNVYSTYRGKPSIRLKVYTVGDQSPIDVSNAVKSKIKELEPHLHGDLRLDIVTDESVMFAQRADLLAKNGIFGLVLVIIFLSMFLDLRLAFWVSMGIPISYMGAFLILPATDFSLNMVSMFAFIVTLGIVVDDAIVVGENIYHKREIGMKPLKASVEGAREMAIPVLVSVTTNMVAFMPMFFMSGFMGKIFALIPTVVVTVFFLSLLESLFILPAHLTFKQAKTLKGGIVKHLINIQKKFNKSFNNFVVNTYCPILEKIILIRYIAFSVFIAILIATASYAASGRVGMVLFSPPESDFSYGEATLPVGSPEQSVRNVEKIMLDAAQSIVDEFGGDDLAQGVYSEVNENEITIFAFLTDPEIRPISTKKFTEIWRERTGQIPGLESLTFKEDLGGPGGSSKALTIELSHNDTDVLDKAAVELAELLTEFPSTRDISDGSAQGKRQFDFKVSDLGYTLGLTPAEIGRQVRGAFYGSEVLKQQNGRNEVRVLTLLPEEERDSEYFFQNMMIKTPDGTDVMLRDVVNYEEGRAYTTIKRRDRQRILTVESDIFPRSETSVLIATLDAEIMPSLMVKYRGLTYSYEGQQADMRESMASLATGMVVIVFVMYGILAILFSSYVQPLMILIAIPFSIIGAVIGHMFMGIDLSIVSMFGIIALAGVVINDSLILIDMINNRRKKGLSAHDAVIDGAKQRFRPIILTTLTTFIGLAPMMFETSRQAQFLIPMAVSLGFGVLFATFLTLVLIPSLYLIVEDIKSSLSRIFYGKPEEPIKT